MKRLRKTCMCLLCVVVLLSAVGCSNKTDSADTNQDGVTEDVEDGIDNAVDDAGDAVDDAVDDTENALDSDNKDSTTKDNLTSGEDNASGTTDATAAPKTTDQNKK